MATHPRPQPAQTDRGQFTARIVDQSPLGRDHFSLVMQFIGRAAASFRKAQPGQFIQLACRDLNLDDPRLANPVLRRPISVAGLADDPTVLIDPPSRLPDFCGSEQTGPPVYLRIIYRAIGPATRNLSQYAPGDELNVLGPLGHGFTLPTDPTVRTILLGGGVGLPPMLFLADRLAAQGQQNTLVIAAARTEDLFACGINPSQLSQTNPLEPQQTIAELSHAGTPALLATDDGTVGIKGNVVSALTAFLDDNPDWRECQLFACGPDPMLKAVAGFSSSRGLPCQVCLEAYMACGIGLCQSCACRVHPPGNDAPDRIVYKLACSDGPVFDAAEVVWE